jgi:hypothetical protein
MAVRGALELQHHQAKLTRTKEGKEGDGNRPPARSQAPTRDGEEWSAKIGPLTLTMATAGGSKGWSGGRRSNDREESDAGAAAAAIGSGGARKAAAMARWPLAPLWLLLAHGESEMGGTSSDRAV